jgi:hypothetical protein
MLAQMRGVHATRHARRLLAATLCALATLAGAAAAAASLAHSLTRSSGTTSATLSWRSAGPHDIPPYSGVRLRIRRGGATLVDRPVRALLCGTLCWPGLIAGSPALAVLDLEGTRSPEVVVNLYSGGAHCCFLTQVYRYDAAGPGSAARFEVVQRDWGDPGARIERLHGIYLFRSADDRFAYEFAAFAFSGLPIAIWRFEGGRFVDVTRRHPALVAADAALWWSAFRKAAGQREGDGLIAAWAADEYLLGRRALVASTLAAQDRAGRLGNIGGPAGAAFIRALDRFLVRTGYA